MTDTIRLCQTCISLSQFNQEGADAVFQRLHFGDPVAVQSGGRPLAVLLAPEEYRRLKALEEENEFLAAVNQEMAGELPSFLREEGFSDDEKAP